MATTTTRTNKPLNPRAQDLSPKGYNRASLYSGKALDFDGVNDTLKGGEPFNYTNHAISANFSTSSASAYKIVFDGRDGGTDGPLITIEPGNGLKYLINGVSTTEYIVSGDEWYNVVGVYDGTNQSIYINGQLWETITNSGSVSVTTNWSVGVRSFSTEAAYFDGMIGGVKAYSTALTAAQVADLYLNPEKIVPDGVADSALKLWLPMMEGAGTTAYDGSGNGNHGTISGATWTSGIGAPVSQTALIGWNKGANKITYSEDFSQSVWSKTQVNIEGGYTAPDGSNTAYKVTYFDTSANLFGFGGQALGTHKSIWAKTTSGTGTTSLMNRYNEASSVFTITNEWQRFDVAHSGGDFFYAVDMRGGGLTEVILWGAQMIDGATEAGPYIPTIGTAQTSPVLLPQGLTANKDITGVNAVSRNAYALNLDGASWAEVHDNASLDITTAITLEVWVYWDGISTDDGIIGRWGSISAEQNYMLYAQNVNTARFYINNSSISAPISNGWNHFIGTYDKTSMKFYVNGSLENSSANTAAITTSDKPIEIGRYYHGATAGARLYNNAIAQPRIYNRALTATEVARNYNADRSKFGL